jgi:Domain of unknown function (DUF4145)
MSTKVMTLDKRKGQAFNVPCQICSGKPKHIVLCSVDINGSESMGNHDNFYWRESDQIIQCQGCEKVSFRAITSNSEDYDCDEDGNTIEAQIESLFPPRLANLKSIPVDDSWAIDSKVRSIYLETMGALHSGSPLLAAIGLRAIVEAVCKSQDAQGNDLLKKIDDLVAKGVLTPSGAAVLHKIRALGNKAAHEVLPHTEKQLAVAMAVVENLLQTVYIIPTKAAAEFGEDD